MIHVSGLGEKVIKSNNSMTRLENLIKNFHYLLLMPINYNLWLPN